MRRIAIVVLFLVFASRALGEPPHFHAGVVRLTVADNVTTFDTVVFYPTDDPEVPWQAGPFAVEATRNAALVAGRRFPVVLISHGRRGSPMSHRELGAALARAGFVAILPTHVGDASGSPPARTQAEILIARPGQAEAALNAVLSNPRFSAGVDENRIGMIGYSAGGYTALILAGAKPDFSYAGAFCVNHGDPGSCPRPATDGSTQRQADATSVSPELIAWHPPVDHRLKALVLMDPLAIMFDASSFSSVHVPALLYRPQSDIYLSSARNALAVATGLPIPPEVNVVPGNHFVFVDPCPAQIADSAPFVCQDASGIDRPSIHRQIESEVVNFFQANL
ncbi:dienelactone hydrolase [Trinickia terrae]|uniref:Dienelactone hydrolase n=1 Tax=Trinickia terrae TaxID=2571161 RepID=A0A4U1I3S0_9BURK|nr:dienelactone hydrolase family protein [Trinickia terrae]TKC87886.1 dienelactone hydrolase [Trinickia terrae]